MIPARGKTERTVTPGSTIPATTLRIAKRLQKSGQRLEQIGAGRGQATEKTGQGLGRVALQHLDVVDAGDPGQFCLEVQHRAQIGIVAIQITKGAAEERKKLRLVVVRFSAKLDQFDEVGCRLGAPQIFPDAAEWILQRYLGK